MSANTTYSPFTHEDFIAAAHAIKKLADSHGYGWVLTESVAETISVEVFKAVENSRFERGIKPLIASSPELPKA